MLPSKSDRDFRRSVSCVAILFTVTENPPSPSPPPPLSSSVADGAAAAGDSLPNKWQRLFRCRTFGVGISVTVTEKPSLPPLPPTATAAVTEEQSLPPATNTFTEQLLPATDTVTKKPPLPPTATDTSTKKTSLPPATATDTVTVTKKPSLLLSSDTVTKKPSLPPLPPPLSGTVINKPLPPTAAHAVAKKSFPPPAEPRLQPPSPSDDVTQGSFPMPAEQRLPPPPPSDDVTKKPLPPPPSLSLPPPSSAAAVVKIRRRPSSEIVIDISSSPPPTPKVHNDEVQEKRRTTCFNLSYSSLSRIPTAIASLFKSPNDQIPAAAAEERRDEGQQLVDRIVKAKDLNSLRQLGGADQVASRLNSNLNTGLTLDPNTTTSSGSWWWYTVLNPTHNKHLVNYLIKSCNSYTILLLLISAALSLVTRMLAQGPKQGWHGGVTILAVVVLIVTSPALAEFVRAKKTGKKLRKEESWVKVVRGGEQMIQESRVVVGDVVDLKKGDRVPGDGLFVASGGKLMVNDPLASAVDWDHNPFLSSGFKVLEGNGPMLVTSVGTDTEIGKVMRNVSNDPYGRTLLQSRIEGPTSYADKIPLCISILITLVLFIRFLRRNHVGYDNELSELKGEVKIENLMKLFEKMLLRPRGLVCILTTTLTAVVLGLQHGMSLAITISLSYWNQKIEKSDRANPQNLSACGTMGIVTAICLDVSGGVMFNEMEVGEWWVGQKEINTEVQSNISQVVLEPLRQGISVSDLVPEDLRSPMDSLLKSWAGSFGEQSSQLCDAVAMEFNEKGRRVLVKKKGDDEKTMQLHSRGPAPTILSMCSHYFDCGGISHALENQRGKFEGLIKGMEDKGFHPVAFAYKQTDVKEIREDGLILLALVGFKFREDTKSAVESLIGEGLNIVLVSGDELEKAIAFAIQLGIRTPDENSDNIATGEEFRKLVDSKECEMMKKITVIGRCSPEDKLSVIQSLKQLGQVVVFVGGSTLGDAAALKEADVGITVEIQSTETAKICSDIVIRLGGGLSSVTLLLKRGRCVYQNIEKFIQLQLIVCISGTLITAVSTMSLGQSSLTAVQLLWGSAIVCTLGVMMMVMEPQNQETKAHQPKPTREESIMTMVMYRNIAVQVLYQASVLLILQFKGQAMVTIHGVDKNVVVTTTIFNTFILCQLFNLFNVMELEKKETIQVVVKSYRLLASLGGILVMQMLLIQLGTSLAVGSRYVRLNCVQWAFCFLASALSWGFDRALKFICVHLNKLSAESASSYVLFFVRTPSPFFPFMVLFYPCS